jgi:hypothetical protein
VQDRSDPDRDPRSRRRLPDPEHYCVFEYLYRDAGNFKAFGRLLLRGRFGLEVEAALRAVVGADGFFVAEQVGVPPLYAELWALSSGPCSDDHVFHEFFRLRRAEEEDLRLPIWGDLDVLVHRLGEACRAPDLAASPHFHET